MADYIADDTSYIRARLEQIRRDEGRGYTDQAADEASRTLKELGGVRVDSHPFVIGVDGVITKQTCPDDDEDAWTDWIASPGWAY